MCAAGSSSSRVTFGGRARRSQCGPGGSGVPRGTKRSRHRHTPVGAATARIAPAACGEHPPVCRPGPSGTTGGQRRAPALSCVRTPQERSPGAALQRIEPEGHSEAGADRVGGDASHVNRSQPVRRVQVDGAGAHRLNGSSDEAVGGSQADHDPCPAQPQLVGRPRRVCIRRSSYPLHEALDAQGTRPAARCKRHELRTLRGHLTGTFSAASFDAIGVLAPHGHVGVLLP